ncbi:PqqD family peptide modification chaperone [Halomonas kalidii]|uniref:PqqD family peptide modification chaperone n=1 Tax=Halomonas kalidii TaxID=3043293 RepID=A0ABT6VJM0_9GAMM|nr:PqqD family peptide modification chaperone [Halomonas kalidii]MDI5934185.1 PqqD family peptide modification chaperone [Halomonas kalidii]
MNMQSRVRRRDDPLTSHLGDDLVIFSARNGKYYGTQDAGTLIWSLIEHDSTVLDVCEGLMHAFDVDRRTCERDVIAFLEQLEQEGLITVH